MNEQEFRQQYEGTFDPIPEKKIFIVSGDYYQSSFVARVTQLPRQMWKHVSRVDDLRGQMNIQVFFYGTWYRRSDAEKIAEYVDTLVREKMAEIVDFVASPEK